MLLLINGHHVYSTSEIKKLFLDAVNSEKNTLELLAILEKQNPPNTDIRFAYWGATETLMGKHATSPFTKLSWLDKGLLRLNQAVQASPNLPEPRYLRISVESQVPSFLGRSKHLMEDKKIVLEQLKLLTQKKDCAKVTEIGNALIALKVYNNSETSLLRNMINTCVTR